MTRTRLYKYIAFSAFAVIVLLLAVATIVEKIYGSDVAQTHIYRAPWMVFLWGVAACIACLYVIQRKLYKQMATFLIHVSLLLILVGAFCTYKYGKQGYVHLRVGETTQAYVQSDNVCEHFPFQLKLREFELRFHDGTFAPMDYVSHLQVLDEGQAFSAVVSMNNVFSHRGYRFYQSGYDADQQGATLRLNYDPWGIGLTYAGYGLLFAGMLCFFFARASMFRGLLQHPALRTHIRTMALLLLCSVGQSAHANTNEKPETLSPNTAEAFGKLCVYYNDRICPLHTVAYDFMQKVHGGKSYKGLTPEQVLVGWLFYYDKWKNEPFIRVKDGEVQQLLGIDGRYARLSDFTTPAGYKLQDALVGSDTALKRKAEVCNEQFNLVSMLATGSMLRIYPCHEKDDEGVQWFSLTDELQQTMPCDKEIFVKQTMNLLTEKIAKNDEVGAVELIEKIANYQQQEAASVIPSSQKLRAERIYTTYNLQPVLPIVCITLGLFYFLFYFISDRVRRGRVVFPLYLAVSVFMLCYLTSRIGLRWYVGGHVPLTNGFETLQFLAWISALVGLCASPRYRVVAPISLLLCGATMMVAMMGESSPQITPLMPVLHSPLLSIHVAVIMIAYCLLAFCMLCGVAALIVRFNRTAAVEVEYLSVISRIMLYPSVFLLAVGIFVGAIWANVSWGRYWGWDPKEVWALITLFLYVAPLHTVSLPMFRRHMTYHIYMICAFLAVVMTYFGVNYLLGGMHSYA